MNHISHHTTGAEPPFTRRRFLALAAMTGAGLLSGGCTSLKLVAHLYPESDRGTGETSTLRAFVLTVIPGLPGDGAAVTRVFFDENYPFARFRAFFVNDLDQRAGRLFSGRGFANLDLTDRTRVVEQALGKGGIIARLYSGAVFLTQVAVYGSIYDDDNGCPLIGFHGRDGILSLEEQTFPDSVPFLATTLTSDGNFN